MPAEAPFVRDSQTYILSKNGYDPEIINLIQQSEIHLPFSDISQKIDLKERVNLENHIQKLNSNFRKSRQPNFNNNANHGMNTLQNKTAELFHKNQAMNSQPRVPTQPEQNSMNSVSMLPSIKSAF